VAHPALIDAEDIEVLHGNHTAAMLRDVYGYRPGWGQVSAQQREDVIRLMAGAPVGGSAPPT